MSHWNHRITRETVTNPDGSADFLYAIREVHYDDAGEVTSWTKDPVAAAGDTPDEVVWALDRMIASRGRGVLDLETRKTLPIPDAGVSS